MYIQELFNLPSEVTLTTPQTSNQTWMDRSTVANKPPLASLNEMLAQSGLTSEFEVVEEFGVPNDKVFVFRLVIDGRHKYTAQGKSKKLAKQSVALIALENQEAWFSSRHKRAWDEEGEGGKGGEEGERGEEGGEHMDTE